VVSYSWRECILSALWTPHQGRIIPHAASFLQDYTAITLGVIYPSIGFALWHISPQLVVPAETGEWAFVASTFFLGISYGWISYRTGSIKWNAISHSIGGILDLGGAIAPSILVLVTQ
jgi:membrane protease YdiL (CAAX protease family)